MLFDCGAAEYRLFYRTREHQQDQFRAVAAYLPEGPKRLLDVGCGYGDFVAWLPEGYTYRGIDLSPPAIEEARRLHPLLDFAVTHEVTDADVIVAVAVIQTERVPPAEFVADLVAHAPLVILTSSKKWGTPVELPMSDYVVGLFPSSPLVVDSEDDWTLFVFERTCE